jgi:hypothetical protein
MTMKMTILLAALEAASCAPSRTTMARYPNAAPTFDRAKSDPKALELADKVVAAAGGMDKWNAVKQIRWSLTITNDGKVAFDGEEGWDRWNARAYGRLIQSQADVVVRRELYGEGAEAYAEMAGKKQRLDEKETPGAVKIASERWQFDSAALCAPFLLEDVGSHLDYVGKAQGDAGPLEVLKLTFDPADKARAGTSYQIDIDPTTFAVARIEIIKPDGNIGYKASGTTDVNGMKFPTIETNIGVPGEVFTYKKISTGDVEEGLYQLTF